MNTIDEAGEVHVHCTKCGNSIIVSINKYINKYINHQGPIIIQCDHCDTRIDIQDLVAKYKEERKEEIMCKGYKQWRPIKLQDILDLEEGSFKDECLTRLTDCGIIEKVEPKWEKITFKDLHRIRPGVTLKHMLTPRDQIIHVASDPYWSSWGQQSHIFVYKEFTSSEKVRVKESSINDLFREEDVYISV